MWTHLPTVGMGTLGTLVKLVKVHLLTPQALIWTYSTVYFFRQPCSKSFWSLKARIKTFNCGWRKIVAIESLWSGVIWQHPTIVKLSSTVPVFKVPFKLCTPRYLWKGLFLPHSPKATIFVLVAKEVVQEGAHVLCVDPMPYTVKKKIRGHIACFLH